MGNGFTWSGGRRCVATCVLLAAAAACAPAVRAADVGERAAAAFERVLPGLVAVDYTVRLEAGSVAASAPGIVVSETGLVMAAMDFFPEQVRDADVSDIEIGMVPGTDARPRVYEGAFLGRDRTARAAFLQIEAGEDERFTTIAFDRDAHIELGQQVLLLGVMPETLGRRRYFTLGRVTSSFSQPFVQYGLALEFMPGAMPAPGAPILDLRGHALGVLQNLSAGAEERAGTLATLWPMSNFAAALGSPPDPTSDDKAPWIGIIGMQDVGRDLAEFWHLPAPGGVVVGYVIPGSPARDAGLVAEDVILTVAERPVWTRIGSSVQNLIEIVRRQRIGSDLLVRVWNDGEVRDVAIRLRERPKDVSQAERFRVEGEFRFTVREMVFLDRFTRDLPVDQLGVVVSFTQPGWAVDGGLQANDVVTHIDGGAIAGLDDFEQSWQAKVVARPQEIVLSVVRGETNEVILVRIECPW